MDQQLSEILLFVALALAALGLLLGGAAFLRAGGIKKLIRRAAGAPGDSLLGSVANQTVRLDQLQNALASTQGHVDELIRSLSMSARNVAVVRYDAFEEMGGQMSFSAAVVDDVGSGIVLTAINGRTEARTYAKAVDRGESDAHLSPEERKAIAEALSTLEAHQSPDARKVKS